jgi:hypothetical protein
MANIAKAPSSAPPPPLSHEHARDRQRCQGTIVRPAADLCRDNKRTPSSAPLPTQPASRGWPTKLRHRHSPHRSLVAMPASEPCGPPCHRLLVAPASKRWLTMPGHHRPPRRRLVVGQACTHQHLNVVRPAADLSSRQPASTAFRPAANSSLRQRASTISRPATNLPLRQLASTAIHPAANSLSCQRASTMARC